MTLITKMVLIVMTRVMLLMVTMLVLVVVDPNAGGTVRNTSATVMTVCTWASACFCPMIDHSHPALLCLTTLHCDSIPPHSATKLVTQPPQSSSAQIDDRTLEQCGAPAD